MVRVDWELKGETIDCDMWTSVMWDGDYFDDFAVNLVQFGLWGLAIVVSPPLLKDFAVEGECDLVGEFQRVGHVNLDGLLLCK